MKTLEILNELDLKICWECSETRPIFAHNTCLQLNRLINEINELIGDDLEWKS